MKEQLTTISLRASPPILTVFSSLYRLQPISRAELFSRAAQYAISSKPDWKKVAETKLKTTIDPESSGPPEFIQFKIDAALWSEIRQDIQNSYEPHLEHITAPFAIRLVATNYFLYLKALQPTEECKGNNENKSVELAELTADFIKIFFEGGEEANQIREIINKWRLK